MEDKYNLTSVSTKESILITALDLFSQYGYEGVSIRDISERMSLSKAALYKHYKSKRDIFDSIVNRMVEADAERAKMYQLPVDTAENDPDAYRRTRIDSLLSFTEAQFCYFTTDSFASKFRRMLTLEQYRNQEMSKLYQQYFCAGPIGYTSDIFSQFLINSSAAYDAAVEFYAPVFMLYSLYDGADDKDKAYKLLKTHIENFKKQIEKGDFINE